MESPILTFDEFDLDPRLLKVLGAQEIQIPTPIQEQAIPEVLAGHDVIGIAQTGTGKTLAYGLPVIQRIAEAPSRRNTALILTPTRELARQVEVVIHQFGKPMGVDSVTVYGGVGYAEQVKALRKGQTIIVATPGRLIDHIERGNVNLDELSVLVLDEADRMLDMGFLPDLRFIIRKLPRDRQTLMFSATFPNDIARLAADMTRDAVRVAVGPLSKPVDAVRQVVYTVQHPDKNRLLVKILKEEKIESALVFLRTKIRTDHLARILKRHGFKVQAIHGDRSQSQREHALDGFRQGRFRFLLATDVAARGLDVEGISHVINFDIPQNADDYIHRVGRTARASAEGDAITFVSPDEMMPLAAIEQALGRNLPRAEWEGAVPVLTMYHPKGTPGAVAKRAPSRRGRGLMRRR